MPLSSECYSESAFEKQLSQLSPINEELLRVNVKEIHITNNAFRVVKKPFKVFLRLKYKETIVNTEKLNLQGLHYLSKPTDDLSFEAIYEQKPVEIVLMCTKRGKDTEIGYMNVNTDFLTKHSKFEGVLHFFYRCQKTGTLNCEISKEQLNEMNFMTLTNIHRNKVTSLPVKEYPPQYSSHFHRTPGFFSESSSFEKELTTKIDFSNTLNKLKNQVVPFEELLENLKTENSEVVYYTCDKLKFFASQKAYATKILAQAEVIRHIITNYSGDKLVCEQVLGLLYKLEESVSVTAKQLGPVWNNDAGGFIKGIITIWEEYHSIESTSYCIELVIKYISDTYKQHKLKFLFRSENILPLLFKNLGKFISSQIAVPSFILLSEAMQMNSQETVKTS